MMYPKEVPSNGGMSGLNLVSIASRIGGSHVTAESIEGASCKGWLWRRGEKGQTWKKRWCVLQGQWMYYFPTPKKTRTKRVYFMPDWRVIEAVGHREYSFWFFRDETQMVLFAACGRHDYQKWSRLLEEAARPSPPPSLEMLEMIAGSDVEVKDDDKETRELLRLGYKQELMRGVNFAMSLSYSFTACAIVPGIALLYSFGLQSGGPAVMSKGAPPPALFPSFSQSPTTRPL